MAFLVRIIKHYIWIFLYRKNIYIFIRGFEEGGGLFNDCLRIRAQRRINSCRNEPRQGRGSTLLVFSNKKDPKNSLGVFRKSQWLSHNVIKKKDPDQMNDRDPRRRRRPIDDEAKSHAFVPVTTLTFAVGKKSVALPQCDKKKGSRPNEWSGSSKKAAAYSPT